MLWREGTWKMEQFVKSSMLLFVLLNPFLLSVYLTEIVREVSLADFAKIILRASIVSTGAFLLFAWLGDFVFTEVFQVRFSSFLVFGGLLFLVIGLRMMLTGSAEITRLKGGDPQRIAGVVALPFMVGPGTISASVVIGKSLNPLAAGAAVIIAVTMAGISLIAFKVLHDHVKTRNEVLVERYTNVAGRVVALFTGTYAVEMITRGVELWFEQTYINPNSGP